MKQEQLKKSSFLSHLEQLRWHLVYSFLAIILFTIISFINIKVIFDNFIFAFLNPKFPTYEFLCSISKSLCLNPLTLQFQNIDLAGQFNMSLLVAFSFGLIFSFPYILFEFWLFIKPGMYKSERKYARYLIFSSLVLFILGVLFGYYIITPLSLNFLSNFTVLQIYRKHAFVIVLILSSIITPPDVLSQILIAFPLMILYEISIIVVHYVHKKNKI